MKLKKKSLIIFLFIITLILFFKIPVYAGYQEWNSLDYDVTINEDGSMDVIETWDVYVSETNTLFKSFDLRNGNYKITKPKVTQIINEGEHQLKQIDEIKYHVDSNSYYGLMTDSDTFEIAWNVGLDNSTDNIIYKMYYKVENAVKIYDDCTELYWQFLSNNNTMTGKNVKGTIKLPIEVSDIEKLRVWGHGDLTAEIRKDSKDTISFTLPKVKQNKMLEVRIVTEENIYPICDNRYGKLYLDDILQEEQVWADEANMKREEEKEALTKFIFFIIGAICLNAIILLIFILINIKYIKIGKELKEKYSYEKSDLKYFRDIPDEENATPARALYMCNFKNNTSLINNNISKIFAATILDLSLKGLITFENINEKEIRICKTLRIKNDVKLSEDEDIIYKLIGDAMSGKDYITTKEFSKYASKEYDKVYLRLNRLNSIVKSYEIDAGKFSEKRIEICKKWSSKSKMFLTLTIFLLIFTFWITLWIPTLIIGFGMLAYTCRKNSLHVSILSNTGYEEVSRWKGLKNYMNDYSLLKDKLVPDIVLWEKYLVYATAFGISKKVIEQLKVVHPEMFEQINNDGVRNYTYWNIIATSSFNGNSFDDFSRSLEKVYRNAQSAYNTAHSSSSSGSGGGGGFSSGGGGRRRRWKLWWTLKYV